MRYLALSTGALLLAGCAAPTSNATSHVAPVAHASEQSDICVAAAQPDIDVSFDTVTSPEDRTQSFRALTDARPEEHTGKKRYFQTLGRIDVLLNATTHFDGKGRELSNGNDCVYLTKATIVIHWKNDIKLASEITPDSCADKFVSRRLTDVIAHQQDYQAGMKQKVENAVREASRNTIIDASLDHAKQRLLDTFQAAVNTGLEPEEHTYFQELREADGVDMFDEIARQCNDPTTKKLLEATAAR